MPNNKVETVILVFTDEGTPATGLTPVFSHYINVTDPDSPSALTQPTVYEIGNGQYAFRPTAMSDSTLAFKVDSGDVTMLDADRYVDGAITWVSETDISNLSNLDVVVSSRMPKGWIESPDNIRIKKIYEKVKALQFDDDENVFSHPNTTVEIETQPLNIDGIIKAVDDINVLFDSIGIITDDIDSKIDDVNANIKDIEFNEEFKALEKRLMYLKADVLDGYDVLTERLDAVEGVLKNTANKDDLQELYNKPTIIHQVMLDTEEYRDIKEKIDSLFEEHNEDIEESIEDVDDLFTNEPEIHIEGDDDYEELFKFDKK